MVKAEMHPASQHCKLPKPLPESIFDVNSVVHPSPEGDLLKDHHRKDQEPCGREFHGQLNPDSRLSEWRLACSKRVIEGHVPSLHTS